MLDRLYLLLTVSIILTGCGGGGTPSGDTTPVKVTITSPSVSPAVLRQAGVGGLGLSISGTATPASGEITQVRFEVKTATGATVPDGVGLGTVVAVNSQSTQWVMDSLPLRPGTNRVLVTAFDSAGRSGQAEVEVDAPAVYIAVQTQTKVVFKAIRLEQIPIDIRNSPATFILARVPGGTYQIGADSASTVGYDPLVDTQRPASLPSYYIALTELNRIQWANITHGATLDAPRTPYSFPVVDISRIEAATALAAFGAEVGLALRLPQDAEWEVAARASATTGSPYAFPGSTDPSAWVLAYDTSGYPISASAVGARLPNAWGFYDMGGNVMEWTDSTIRDGSWSDNLVHTRISSWFTAPDSNCIHPCLGLRVGLSAD